MVGIVPRQSRSLGVASKDTLMLCPEVGKDYKKVKALLATVAA